MSRRERPTRLEPPSDRTKRQPRGAMPKTRNGGTWELAGSVGEFLPETITSRRETRVLTAVERAANVTKIDAATDLAKLREDRVRVREELSKRSPVDAIIDVVEEVSGGTADRVRRVRN